MKGRLTTVLLVLGLVVFASGVAYATSSHLSHGHHGKKHHTKKHHAKKHKHAQVQKPSSSGDNSNGESSAQSQYGTRPGKGCGDRNHVHTGPPGNPSNTACPPQSQHGTPSTTSAAQHNAAKKHSAKHHGRRHAPKRRRKHGHH